MQSRTSFRILLILAATFLLSTSAQALVFRAYVASDGNDANPCTLPQPCRLLPAALAAVADGGEIWMLDSANYNAGTVVVAKSVTILAVPGVIGSVVATAGPAISITAPSLTVVLRNVVVVPLPGTGGTIGVSMTGASVLMIEDSVFANLPNAGVDASAGWVRVTNSTFRKIAQQALAIRNGARADVAGSRFAQNNTSLLAITTTAVTSRISVSDSVFALDNISIASQAAGSGVSTIDLTRCSVTQSFGAAIWVRGSGGGLGMATIGSSMISQNVVGLHKDAGGGIEIINSYGNNQFNENGGPAVALGPATLQ